MSTAGIKLRDALAALKWKNLSPKDVAEVVAEEIQRAVQPLHDRIAALEASDFEKCYQGVYEAQAVYKRHNMVSAAGSMWVALKDDPGRPGAPNSGWQLAVKKGRDARD